MTSRCPLTLGRGAAGWVAVCAAERPPQAHTVKAPSVSTDYADKPLEKPLKLVLKVGGSEVTELSGSGHDSSYYDDRSDHERERHKEKKKKKKKKTEKEKHLDDEERRKRKVNEGGPNPLAGEGGWTEPGLPGLRPGCPLWRSTPRRVRASRFSSRPATVEGLWKCGVCSEKGPGRGFSLSAPP